MLVWVVGMGEIVEMDCRGRITIPASIRRVVGRTRFKVELAGESIVLKPVESRRELVEKIVSIRLSGDRERASVDAALIKDLYGGFKA